MWTAAARHAMPTETAFDRESLRAMAEDAVFGMYRSTRDGRLLMVNQTLVAMLGYASADELRAAGIPRAIWLSPEIRLRRHSAVGPIDVFETREAQWRRKDGREIVVRVSGHAVRDGAGHTVAYDAIVEDVTERRELEQQLRQSQKLESIGQLAGGIAHDLNNLLTAVLATTEMLRLNRGGDVELDTELGTIEAVTQRGAAMIRKLLAFSRRQLLELRTISLGRVVEDAVEMLRRLMPANLEIALIVPETGTEVVADPGAVEQILLNLLTNARDATPGGGRVVVQVSRATLDQMQCAGQGWGTPGEYVVLAVSDTGMGMDPETRRRAFEPFFTTKPAGVGTGLGLSTVYGLAKQQGGFTSISSEPGRSTTVRVLLPASALSAAVSGPAAPAELGRGTETILLAEDEPAVRLPARRVLERHGYRVIEASDGAEALERWRQRAAGIDLVLTDVAMPRLSGPDLLRAIHAEGYRGAVVLMSGYSAGDLSAAVTRGAVVVQKPWTLRELLGSVRTALDRARAPALVA
jgi:PAS domain S-box-containing protein